MNFPIENVISDESVKNIYTAQRKQKYSLCRICFSEGSCNQEQANRLLSPCNCKGSQKYVHENCIFTWIKKKLKEKEAKDGMYETQCEICKAKMNYVIQLQYTLRTCYQIQEEIREEIIKFVVGVVFLLMLFALISFILVTLLEDKEFDEGLSVSIVIIVFLLLLIFTYFFVHNFIKKPQVKILSVEKKTK